MEFSLDLKICQICYMPSPVWNSDRNLILKILFTFLMYLLFERCITGLILVSVLHSCTLSLSLVYHFVWSVLLLSGVIFIDIFWHIYWHIFIARTCLFVTYELVCLKLESAIFINFFSPNDSPSKTMKNAIYFIKKALSFSR